MDISFEKKKERFLLFYKIKRWSKLEKFFLRAARGIRVWVFRGKNGKAEDETRQFRETVSKLCDSFRGKVMSWRRDSDDNIGGT